MDTGNIVDKVKFLDVPFKRKAVRSLSSLYSGLPSKTFEITIGGDDYEFLDKWRARDVIEHIADMEGPILEDALRRVSEDDVFFDVGAAFGTWACVIGRGADEVHTFEPNPFHTPFISRHLRLNGVRKSVHELALGEQDGTIQLLDGTIDIGARSLDSKIEDGLPMPNVVKIDIEGAELAALRGARETLASPDCHTVYLELHTESLSGERQHGKLDQSETVKTREILRSHGFEITDVTTNRSSPFVRASK